MLFRPICSLFCLFILLSEAYAQTEKGNILLGGNAGMSFYSEQNENVFNASLSPRIGFFVANRFAVGASLPLGLNTSKNYESWNIGIGPFARYYFGSGKIMPLIEAEVSLNRFRSRYRELGGNTITNTYNMRNIGVGLGLAYFLTPAIGLEGILSYDASRSRVNSFGSSTRGQLNLNVGFQIYFSRNQE